MSERLYWTQHAPIERRPQEIVGSGTDRGLSEIGIERANFLARQLAKAAFFFKDFNETIVTSPLRRARQTSEIISDALGFTVVVDDDLRAQHFGDIEGKTIPEILADPQLSPHLHRNLPEEKLLTDAAPNGESIESAKNRMITARQRMLAGEGSPLIITHGSVLNTLIGTARDLSVKEWKDISAEFKGKIIQDSGLEISSLELPNEIRV